MWEKIDELLEALLEKKIVKSNGFDNACELFAEEYGEAPIGYVRPRYDDNDTTVYIAFASFWEKDATETAIAIAKTVVAEAEKLGLAARWNGNPHYTVELRLAAQIRPKAVAFAV